MLIGEEGLVDSVLSALFGIDGPLWFNDRRLALGSNIVAYIWKPSTEPEKGSPARQQYPSRGNPSNVS